ncbi:MAG: enoyl-CoA hydratase/isomerase family protein [Chloroflexi bacterium]|nr:enoyl-CoA hydratase/isomerase family protein [Chloroflexota bacterium]
MAMPEEPVLLDVQDGVATITLNRPQSYNSISDAMMDTLAQALGECQRDAVRAVVLAGAGRGFCSGADLREFTQALRERGAREFAEYLGETAGNLHRRVILPIRRLLKPVLAAVNGVAAGAGFSLALACDLRVASQDARFVLAYSNIGASPDGGSSFALPRLVGQARAMELYLLNETLDAARARELGLVALVVPQAELAARSAELARRLASGPTLAYGRAKALFDRSWTATLETQLELEANAIAACAVTADFAEGILAFSEKRTPVFKGR